MSIAGIALVNSATAVTDDQLNQIGLAIQGQIATDFGPAWNLPALKVLPFVGLESVPQDAGWFTMRFVDQADDPGTYGYHNPFFAEIECGPILENGGGILASSDGTAISVVASHEALELMADPDVNLWLAKTGGPKVALEVCDPVQECAYYVHGVAVSDFVLPGWFGIGGGLYDHLGLLDEPFKLAPGGYCVQEAPDGTTSTVYGSTPLPAWRKTHRRLERMKRDHP